MWLLLFTSNFQWCYTVSVCVCVCVCPNYWAVDCPPTDQVAIRDEGISDESRVYFIDSARKMNRQLFASQVPSVNFRGLMDPVSGRIIVGVGGCSAALCVVCVMCDDLFSKLWLLLFFAVSVSNLWPDSHGNGCWDGEETWYSPGTHLTQGVSHPAPVPPPHTHPTPHTLIPSPTHSSHPPHRKLLGIVTKKDVLRHMAELENKDPSTIRFH